MLKKFYENQWGRVMAGMVDHQNLEDVFTSRLSALMNSTHGDEKIKIAALDYLKKTSVSGQFHDEEGAMKLSGCEHPEIKAMRVSDNLNAVVYKIKNKNNPEIHEIAFFEKSKEGAFLYSHKEDLVKLYNQFCLENNVDCKIRQIGDEVLHRAARDVLNFSGEERAELESQLKILSRNLFVTGGVGIAANQCGEIENPLKLIVSGVNYNNPEHVVKAITRYQTALFPPMKVLVNPEIVSMDSEETEFTEGCLSVRGSLRGVVKRPKSVTVKYRDLDGGHHEEAYAGTDARVMLHELDHILNGFVYMQRLISEFSYDQCCVLQGIIEQVLVMERALTPTALFLSPITVFSRGEDGKLVFDQALAKNIFLSMSNETLQGLSDKLSEKICLHRPKII
ncbi:MAG TPA: peptide deformylase [Gammaproteobacteria bacterium]|nr:peptide deformylase [Gammaproteobacteria bacterium]